MLGLGLPESAVFGQFWLIAGGRAGVGFMLGRSRGKRWARLMMSAKNRYWDHEACSWVTYDPASEALPATLAAAMPEQRGDEPVVAAVEAIAPAE